MITFKVTCQQNISQFSILNYKFSIQKATFRNAKDRLSPSKRPPFAHQKTAFYNALNIKTLQQQIKHT